MAILLPQGRIAAQQSATPRPDADAVLAEVKLQMRTALQGIKGGSGEAARHAASLVHVWAAHVRDRVPDARVRALARQAVNRQGRAGVIDGSINHAEITSTIRELGLSQAEIDRLELHTPADLQEKERALDRILDGGIAPIVERTVSMLTSAAARFDAGGPVRQVSLQSGTCQDVCLMPALTKSEMEIVCALAAMAMIFPFMVVFAEPCALLAAIWLHSYGVSQTCQLVFG